MITRAFLVVALAATVRCAAVAEESSSDRDSKLFPVVQIVTFENGPCTAGTGERGTCYSQKECETLQGSASGTCANGFGVCCVLQATCDGTISVNGTYFTNPGYPSSYASPGMCSVLLKPPAGTCQILIDFDAFNLMGPVEGECGNDTFVVMGANPGSTVPVLCGDNSGQHIYLDVDNTNDPIQLIVTNSANSYGRQWKAGITFIGENDPCKAPPRCLQYHKNTAGSIMSFNYGSNPMMLTNQLYSICFGYVPGYCDIGLNFDRFDLGNINQACENDYLAIGGQQHCGDYSPYTAQANATGPIAILVASDSDNSREEEGFSGNYMMMPC
ncbi:neuropilin-1-like [Macrobrachium nipponense]|uniref:neuropilin-1-like n=1 Tax=Macrobrachium nipponense TaxID=159736 RepID=UPI0030C89219